MREIKFRYWDGKSMYISETLAPMNELFVEPDVQAIMQYTGLHDKNDKEIYEGDIVKYHDSESAFQIAWYQFGFHFAWNDGAISMPATHPEFYEVIGNIYENPELMKGEK